MADLEEGVQAHGRHAQGTGRQAGAESGRQGCSKCGKPAAITLRYASQQLCQSHFTEMFERRVKRTVRNFRMLRKGETVAVGLSGGKDSCVMLHMLHRISKSLPIKLFAITIDEGIAGYRPRSLEVAESVCKALGIPLKVVGFKGEFGKSLDQLLKEKGEKHSCSYCGVMRRRLLNLCARKFGADKMAIGHNSDDAAQTILMNYMRNEPERLARFGPVSGTFDDEKLVPRIKPLFLTPERDVAAYAIMKGIPVEFSECPYAKNAFRQHVREILNRTEEKYPCSKLRVVRTFLAQKGLMQDGTEKRREKGGNGKEIGRCASCGEPSSGDECSLCRMLKSQVA